jgi:hypothetical protein
MSLSAREQQALDSIKKELAGSDTGLAALLSAFTRLASGEEMPEREQIRGSRRALRPFRPARWRSGVRRVFRGLGIQRAAVLLWLLTSAALLAVALAFNVGGGHGTCAEPAVINCADPAPAHSSGTDARGTATDQAPQQQVAHTQQASPKVPPG